MYKIFIQYGEPQNKTDIMYSKLKVLESFESRNQLMSWFAERIYTMLCDIMQLQKCGGILKSIEIDYYNCSAKIIYINGYTIKFHTQETKQ